MYKVYKVEAESFEGRIPCRHEFEIVANNEEEAYRAVQNTWPELYNVKIYE